MMIPARAGSGSDDDSDHDFDKDDRGDNYEMETLLPPLPPPPPSPENIMTDSTPTNMITDFNEVAGIDFESSDGWLVEKRWHRHQIIFSRCLSFGDHGSAAVAGGGGYGSQPSLASIFSLFTIATSIRRCILLSYMACALFNACWWYMILVTLYGRLYHPDDEEGWHGAARWFYFIPLVVSSLGFFLVQAADPIDDGEETVNSKRNRATMFMGLIFVFMGTISAVWIRIGMFGINGAHIIETVNSHKNDISKITYFGAGHALVIHAPVMAFATIMGRWAKMLGAEEDM